MSEVILEFTTESSKLLQKVIIRIRESRGRLITSDGGHIVDSKRQNYSGYVGVFCKSTLRLLNILILLNLTDEQSDKFKRKDILFGDS